MLDCERQHARWQWFAAMKRNLKLPALNGMLRLSHWLERNAGEFPPHEHLEEHLVDAGAQLRWDLRQQDGEDVACGWRFEMLWGDRLNLQASEHKLLREPLARSRLADAPTTYRITWGNYCRNLLAKGFWYQFPCNPSVRLYISENKIVGGREERTAADAMGRPVVGTFFEPIGGGGCLNIRRVERATGAMQPKLLTVAELLSAIGIWPEADPDRSSRETEALLEDLFVDQGLRRLRGEVEPAADEVHVYTVTEDCGAEEAFFAEADPQSLTKIALARLLEIREGASRRHLWQAESLEALRVRAAPWLRSGGAAAASAAKPAGGRPKGKASAMKRPAGGRS